MRPGRVPQAAVRGYMTHANMHPSAVQLCSHLGRIDRRECAALQRCSLVYYQGLLQLQTINAPMNIRWPGPTRWSGLPTLLGQGSSCVRFVMFHGIGGPGFTTPDFVRQLRYFDFAFDVVSIDAALEFLAGGSRRSGKGKRAKLVLTFDDGLVNHAQVVYPLLQRMKLPAIFYVCPGLADTGAWLWPHEARQRLRSLAPTALHDLSARHRWPSAQVNPVVEWMKGLENSDRGRVLDNIRSATPGFKPSASEREQFDVLNWDQLRSLDPGLVTIGSHTVSHPIMTALDDNSLDYELQRSRAWLEEGLQRPIEHFCYPNGSQNTRVRAAAARHYRSAVTTESGYAHADTDLRDLPRVNGDPRMSRAMWKLYRPYKPS